MIAKGERSTLDTSTPVIATYHSTISSIPKLIE